MNAPVGDSGFPQLPDWSIVMDRAGTSGVYVKTAGDDT